MKKSRALIVMAKPPILGFAKTRLAKDVGDEKALEVYQGLLDYTFNMVGQSGGEVIVFFTHENDFTKAFKLLPVDYQNGDDLGEKMEDAFAKVLNDYNEVLMIGADCPDLSEAHIHEAFSALENSDVVFGPGEDGGYYLIGMKKLHTHLFRNKSWSTTVLLSESLEELNEKGLSNKCLEVLNDIDTFEDLKKSSYYSKIEL